MLKVKTSSMQRIGDDHFLWQRVVKNCFSKIDTLDLNYKIHTNHSSPKNTRFKIVARYI